MLPSFYVQLFNTAINVVEVLLLINIAYFSFQNYNFTQGRATKIMDKLDDLIILTENGHRDSALKATKKGTKNDAIQE